MHGRSRLLVLLGTGAWLLALVGVGLPRALERHFHVDEVQLAYDAALFGVHHLPDHATITSPIVIAMGSLLGSVESAQLMYGILRIGFFTLFTLALLACAWAQPYFRSAPGRLGVLVAATTFHPLWSNGFEIRADIITVTGSVTLYGLTQRAANGSTVPARSLFVGGLAAATMLAHSFKALAYAAVFGLVFIVISAVRDRRSGRSPARAPLWFLAGVLAGAVVHGAVMFAAGGLPAYVHALIRFRSTMSNMTHFTPTAEVVRIVLDSPIVFGLAAVHVVLATVDLVKRKCAPSTLITLGFLAWSFAVLYVNPTPFAYNMVHLLPFVFFAALDAISRLRSTVAEGTTGVAASFACVWMLVFLRGWTADPFQTRSNAAQLSYVRAAEALTGPRDSVLDGAGLVLSRPPPDKDWLLHSSRMPPYLRGERTSFTRMMIERPSPVIIDNYRWLWLTTEDLETRASRYVRLAPRLYVLGQELRTPSGDLHVHLRGRYRVVHGADVRIDGVSVAHGGVLDLEVGAHPFSRGGEEPTLVHWLGPSELAASDALGQIMTLGRAEAFFTNEPLLMPH